MKNIKKTIVFFLFSMLAFSSLTAQNSISQPDRLVKLSQYRIKESDVRPGEYLQPDSSFKPYSGEILEYTVTDKPRMFTFTTDFSLDNSLKGQDLSLAVGPSDYPFEIYLNGQLLMKRGLHKDKYISALHTSRACLLPPELLHYGNIENSLTLQAFPQFEQVPLTDISIAGYTIAETAVFWRNFIGVDLVKVSVFFALLIGGYIFALYLTGSKDIKYIYFSLLCGAIVLGYMNIMFSYNNRPELLMEKFSRSGIILAATMLSVFVMEFTGLIKQSRIIKWALISISFILSILIFLQKNKAGYSTIFGSSLGLYIGPQLIFSFVLAMINMVRRRSTTSVILGIGLLCILSASVHDLLYNINNRIPYSWLVGHGFILLLLSIAIILVMEQSQEYSKSLAQTEQLNRTIHTNLSLVDHVSDVSGTLSKSSRKLDLTVQESIKIVEEYRNENTIISNIMYEKLKSIEEVIHNFEERMQVATEKIPAAISNQTAAVEEISATINSMNSNMNSTGESMLSTKENAMNLSRTATESRRILKETHRAISSLEDYTNFINQVMSTIEDITNRTGVLSINAAIEAARAGNSGKGFAVLATEIRSLASQSQNSLDSSFSKLKEMNHLIHSSAELAKDLERQLESIISGSDKSAGMVSSVSEQIQQQREEQQAILESIDSLLDDSLTIKELADNEAHENKDISDQMTAMKQNFNEITDKLKIQEDRGIKLTSGIEMLQNVLEENLKTVQILNSSIKEARE